MKLKKSTSNSPVLQTPLRHQRFNNNIAGGIKCITHNSIEEFPIDQRLIIIGISIDQRIMTKKTTTFHCLSISINHQELINDTSNFPCTLKSLQRFENLILELFKISAEIILISQYLYHRKTKFCNASFSL